MNRPETEERRLRHDFSTWEKLAIADELTRTVAALQAVREAKAEADANFKRQIENHLTTITILSQKFRDGGEAQEVACKILWNAPLVGHKTIVRLDTGEEVAVEEMTAQERQEELALETVEAHARED